MVVARRKRRLRTRDVHVKRIVDIKAIKGIM